MEENQNLQDIKQILKIGMDNAIISVQLKKEIFWCLAAT